MINTVKRKVEDVGLKRCGNCPAFYRVMDYWGEADEGCVLCKDIYEFCPVSLLPRPVAKIYVDYKEKQEEKAFLEWYEKEGYKQELEELDPDE